MSSYTYKPTTTTPFVPNFLNEFSSIASGVLSTSAKREFTIGSSSDNNLYQSYTISAVPTEDTTKPTAYTGSLSSVYTGPEYDILSTYYTDKSSGGDEISVTAKKLADGLKVKATAYSNNYNYGYDNYVGAVETTYLANQLAIRSRFLTDSQKHTFEAFASAGRRLNPTDTLTVGASVRASYANNNTALESEDVGVNYTSSGVGFTLKTSGNLSQVSSIVSQQISPETTIAAQLDAPLSSFKQLPGYPRTLTLGISTRINNYFVRGSANLANGVVAASFQRQINGYRVPGSVGITLQSSLNKSNLNGTNAIDAVGVQFNFGSK